MRSKEDGGVDLVGPVLLRRDEQGRLETTVDGVRYVLMAKGRAGVAMTISEQWCVFCKREPLAHTPEEYDRCMKAAGKQATAAEVLALRAELDDVKALLGRGVELFEGDDEEIKRLRSELGRSRLIEARARKALADIDASGAYGMCDESLHDLREALSVSTGGTE